MALKSSSADRMTVGRIYAYLQYIENVVLKLLITVGILLLPKFMYFRNRFPYFKNCPHSSWKNSVRHSLSLSKNFQRVGTGDMTSKKGLQWETVPSKMEMVEKEVSAYESKEGQQQMSSQLTCSAMVPTAFGFVHASASSLFYCHKSITSTLNSPCTQITNKKQRVPQDSPADYKPLLVQEIRSSHCQHLMGGRRGFVREDHPYSSKSVLRDSQLTSSSMGDIQQSDPLDARLSKCPNDSLAAESRKMKMSSNSGSKVTMNSETWRKRTFSTSLCDILYVQGLLKAVDKAINTEYKQDQDKLDTLTLDEILLVLDDGGGTSSNEELSVNVRQEENKLKYKNKRKRSCDLLINTTQKKTKLTRHKTTTLDAASVMPTNAHPSIMVNSDDNLELLSKAEENLLMKELERDAWKLCKSLYIYLECAAEGIASCITPKHLTRDKAGYKKTHKN